MHFSLCLAVCCCQTAVEKTNNERIHTEWLECQTQGEVIVCISKNKKKHRTGESAK